MKCNVFRGYKTKDHNHPEKSIEQLERTLRKARKKFIGYNLNSYYAWHTVFTVDSKTIQLRGKELIDFMQDKITYVIECIRNKQSKSNQLYYFIRIEANNTPGLYHFHVGLFFKNCPSTTITINFLNNLWGLGYIWINKHKKP